MAYRPVAGFAWKRGAGSGSPRAQRRGAANWCGSKPTSTLTLNPNCSWALATLITVINRVIYCRVAACAALGAAHCVRLGQGARLAARAARQSLVLVLNVVLALCSGDQRCRYAGGEQPARAALGRRLQCPTAAERPNCSRIGAWPPGVYRSLASHPEKKRFALVVRPRWPMPTISWVLNLQRWHKPFQPHSVAKGFPQHLAVADCAWASRLMRAPPLVRPPALLGIGLLPCCIRCMSHQTAANKPWCAASGCAGTHCAARERPAGCWQARPAAATLAGGGALAPRHCILAPIIHLLRVRAPPAVPLSLRYSAARSDGGSSSVAPWISNHLSLTHARCTGTGNGHDSHRGAGAAPQPAASRCTAATGEGFWRSRGLGCI